MAFYEVVIIINDKAMVAAAAAMSHSGYLYKVSRSGYRRCA